MRKILISLFLMLLILPLMGSQRYANNFLAAAISVNDNTTATDGVEFTSRKISVGSEHDKGAITVLFTPAAGAAVSIDFEFAVSTDNGSTWTTGTAGDAYIRIQVNTNVTAVSSIVRQTFQIQGYGITHWKLYRVVVGNGAGNCTAINARISMARR